MKILALGDVVGKNAVNHLEKNLWSFRNSIGADLVVVNGENASDIYGIDEADAKTILSAGADVITLGNHAFGRKNIFSMLSDNETIIRPANYPPLTPGGGYTVINICGWRILWEQFLWNRLPALLPPSIKYSNVKKETMILQLWIFTQSQPLKK